MQSNVIAEYNKRYTLRQLALRLSIPEQGLTLSHEKVRRAMIGSSPFSLDQIYVWWLYGNAWQKEFASKLAEEQYPGISYTE